MKRKIQIYRGILMIIGLLSIGPLWSQQAKIENLINFDEKEYHFGFYLGINQMLFTVKTKPDFENLYFGQNQIPELPADTAHLLNVGVAPTSGFTIGIISDLRLGKYFNLRATPNLQFGERILLYDIEKTDRGNTDTVFGYQKQVPSTLLNFPISIKYKGMRIHNMRPYLILGARYTMDLGAQAKKIDPGTELVDITIKLFSDDIYFEPGVGFDFYFNWFKMSTEIKMSYGLRDVLSHEDNIWTDPIESLKSKVFQFNVTFE